MHEIQFNIIPKILNEIDNKSIIKKFIGLNSFEFFINDYDDDLSVFFLNEKTKNIFIDYL